jgi:hypothetical protein
MDAHGRTTVHEFLSDFIVYRNLKPLDERLPALDDLRKQADVPERVTPRKGELAYARVMVHILQVARALDLPGRASQIRRLLFVGDTKMNDGTAFANIARAGGWPGLAFIASERGKPAPPEIIEWEEGTLYLANRWEAINNAASRPSFEEFRRQRHFPIDEQTAVIIDLDKTAIGARGRNDHVINRARVEAVRRTVGDLLGDAFDPEAFRAAYDELNKTEFHPFTADNQDYLAYVCLILASGFLQLDPLVEQVRAGRMTSFAQFIAEVNQLSIDLPPSLREIHEHVYGHVQAGDPTPFKAFRYNEYRATVEWMGYLGEDASAEELLKNEIVITQEIRQAALRWKAQGALLFGLSDKPDEASIPTDELAAQGYEPIHRVETHAVGGE